MRSGSYVAPLLSCKNLQPVPVVNEIKNYWHANLSINLIVLLNQDNINSRSRLDHQWSVSISMF